MALKDWREYAELVGIFGIIASLILLGYEVRQTRTAIVGETYLSRAILSSEADLSLAHSDHLPNVVLKHREQGLASLSAEERFRLSALANAAKTRMDAYYLQYEYGLLDEEWYQYRFAPSARYWKPIWRDLGTMDTDTTRPSFQAAVAAVPESSN
jgi:hypothetical protein